MLALIISGWVDAIANSCLEKENGVKNLKIAGVNPSIMKKLLCKEFPDGRKGDTGWWASTNEIVALNFSVLCVTHSTKTKTNTMYIGNSRKIALITSGRYLKKSCKKSLADFADWGTIGEEWIVLY